MCSAPNAGETSTKQEKIKEERRLHPRLRALTLSTCRFLFPSSEGCVRSPSLLSGVELRPPTELLSDGRRGGGDTETSRKECDASTGHTHWPELVWTGLEWPGSQSASFSSFPHVQPLYFERAASSAVLLRFLCEFLVTAAEEPDGSRRPCLDQVSWDGALSG